MHANSCADPFAVYDAFGAQYDYDGTEGFRPVEPGFSMDDTRFTGDAAYTIPERRDRPLDATVARSLGAHNVRDLSISREMFGAPSNSLRTLRRTTAYVPTGRPPMQWA